MGPFVHPYIPNSAPEVKRQMLDDMGLTDVEEILAEIPRDLRLDRLLDLPEPLTSELDLRRHVEGILGRNTSCAEYLSFLGGGCWNHFVPAVCDEIVGQGRVPHRVQRGQLLRPGQAPGALRVQQPDGRAARLRGRRRAHL